VRPTTAQVTNSTLNRNAAHVSPKSATVLPALLQMLMWQPARLQSPATLVSKELTWLTLRPVNFAQLQSRTALPAQIALPAQSVRPASIWEMAPVRLNRLALSQTAFSASREMQTLARSASDNMNCRMEPAHNQQHVVATKPGTELDVDVMKVSILTPTTTVNLAPQIVKHALLQLYARRLPIPLLLSMELQWPARRFPQIVWFAHPLNVKAVILATLLIQQQVLVCLPLKFVDLLQQLVVKENSVLLPV